MYIDEFESNPDAPAEPRIYYRTRVYGPDDAPDNFRLGRMEEVNDLRANTVRALRAHFGERFIGGLRDSEHARTYPDCLYAGDPGLYGHVALAKECLVAREYGRAARLDELEDGRIHRVFSMHRQRAAVLRLRVAARRGQALPAGFSTPAECVAACQRLLDEPDTARAMRAENFAYYAAHVRPDQVVRACLRAAFKRSASAACDERPAAATLVLDAAGNA